MRVRRVRLCGMPPAHGMAVTIRIGFTASGGMRRRPGLAGPLRAGRARRTAPEGKHAPLDRHFFAESRPAAGGSAPAMRRPAFWSGGNRAGKQAPLFAASSSQMIRPKKQGLGPIAVHGGIFLDICYGSML